MPTTSKPCRTRHGSARREAARGGRASCAGRHSAFPTWLVSSAVIWTTLLMLLPMGGCAVNGRSSEPRLTHSQRHLNLSSFDLVWQTIRDQHFDPGLGGVDWVAVRRELRPRVEHACTMSAARQAMEDAVERLGLSHFAIIPASAYEAFGPMPEGAETGQPGLTVRVLDGQAVVTAVQPDTPAARAGVRPGWVLVRVGTINVPATLRNIAAAYADSTAQQYMLVRAVSRWLAGPIDQPVTVEFLDDGDRPITRQLDRVAPQGQPVKFGHLPPMHLRFESRQVDPEIGYIAFNLFFEPATLMPRFEESLRPWLGTTRGIVIDLRGNPGGISALAMGIAGWFVAHAEHPLGVMRTRETEIRFAIFPRPETYSGCLAILVDGCSASTAEIMAAGLQELGRARLFGSRTAGAALPSQVIRLPNGDGFQYATADYVTFRGHRIEGVGVTPDVEVPLTRAALLAGRDPALEAAVEWIRSSCPPPEGTGVAYIRP
jgi:carboxyl-terminal processing protease